MYENGSIQRSNFKTYELVLKSSNKLICDLHAQYPLPIILLGFECSKMVAFSALTSRPMSSYLNQLNTLICDLHVQYPLPIILLVLECSKKVAFSALTSEHINSY